MTQSLANCVCSTLIPGGIIRSLFCSQNIYKGLALNLLVDVLYDDDILVQVDRNKNKIYEPGEEGKRPTIIQALLIKYNLVF